MQTRRLIIVSPNFRLFLLALMILAGTACVQVQDTGRNEQKEERPAGEPVKPGTSGNARDLPTAEPREPGTPAKTVNPRQNPNAPKSNDSDDSDSSNETESQ